MLLAFGVSYQRSVRRASTKADDNPFTSLAMYRSSRQCTKNENRVQGLSESNSCREGLRLSSNLRRCATCPEMLNAFEDLRDKWGPGPPALWLTQFDDPALCMRSL